MDDQQKIAEAIAKRLAPHDIAPHIAGNLAEEALRIGQIPTDVNVCIAGICVELNVDRESISPVIDKILQDPRLGEIRLFPKGIIAPDHFLVEVERIVPR